MYCDKCGAKITNEARFCSQCGNSLHNLGEIQISEAEASSSHKGEESSYCKSDTNGNDNEKVKIENGKDALQNRTNAVLPKFLLGIGGVLIVGIVMVNVFTNRTVPINLNNYVAVTTSGYDGYGTANIIVEWDEIEAKYNEKLSFTKQGEALDFTEWYTPVEFLIENVDIIATPVENLRNGDEISYKWDIEVEISEYINCELEYAAEKYKITDLTEVKTFDAFKDVKLLYYGNGPEGFARIDTYVGKELYEEAFLIDPVSELSNGEVITVSINKGAVEDCVKKYGVKPETLEKTFVVEGLGHYISQDEEIDSLALESMKQQAEDTFRAQAAKEWSEGATLENLNYIGNYLLSSKRKGVDEIRNMIHLVYKAQVRNAFSGKRGSFDGVTDVYWYITFQNLINDENEKTSVMLTEYQIPRDKFVFDSNVDDTWYSTKKWTYRGFQTLDQLYSKAVIEYIDLYNHDDNVDKNLAIDIVGEKLTE